MKTMQCEMCGGNDLVKTAGFYVCQNCGTKYAPDEAKKLFINGVVKIDDSEELSNLYSLARRAVKEENYENGYKYYDQILVKRPNDWEANFYSLYCKSWNCTISQIESTASRLTDALSTNFELIQKIEDSDKRFEAAREMCTNLLRIDDTLFAAARKNYSDLDYSIKDRFLQEYVNRCLATILLAYGLGDGIEIFFGEEYAEKLAVLAWMQGIDQHTLLMPNLARKEIQNAEKMKRVRKVQKYMPDYLKTTSSTYTRSSQTGGCYIATAVYGSYDCPQVWTLRRFRDHQLKHFWYGRLFIKVYYALSPSFVKMFGHTNWFNRLFRARLDRMVERLTKKGYDNKPYYD